MLAFITAHWSALVSVVTFLVVAAREIVSLTASTKDDAIEAQVEAILNNFGLINKSAEPTTAPTPPAPPAA